MVLNFIVSKVLILLVFAGVFVLFVVEFVLPETVKYVAGKPAERRKKWA